GRRGTQHRCTEPRGHDPYPPARDHRHAWRIARSTGTRTAPWVNAGSVNIVWELPGFRPLSGENTGVSSWSIDRSTDCGEHYSAMLVFVAVQATGCRRCVRCKIGMNQRGVFMDKKLVGAIGAIAGLATLDTAAQAAPAAAPAQPTGAKSF